MYTHDTSTTLCTFAPSLSPFLPANVVKSWCKFNWKLPTFKMNCLNLFIILFILFIDFYNFKQYMYSQNIQVYCYKFDLYRTKFISFIYNNY